MTLSRAIGVVLLALCISGCEGGEAAGTAQGNCRRFVALVDDAHEGKVPSESEFRRRLDEDIGQFKEGASRRESYGRLVGYIEVGDEAAAANETSFLVDNCLDVLDR